MKTMPIGALAALVLLTAACGGNSSGESPTNVSAQADDVTASSSADEPVTLTLVAYDSFPEDDTSMNEALDGFTADTGIGVELLIAGDTGTMLSKASLTAGNPEGDVMWGVDNTFLSRAVSTGVFEPYPDAPTDNLRAELLSLSDRGDVVPVDFGDVCVNYDIAYFTDTAIDPPASLTDLVDPAYADLLVVQNPATSSPGLAFLLATVDEFGVDGWQDYWEALTANGVSVADGWTDAYYGSFTAASDGDRPLVVSYGSSPPAQIIFGDPPTSIVESTCFRQIEYAGVLAGTDHPEQARQLIDFLVSDEFQSELALNLFVYPSNSNTALPQEFVDFAIIPDAPRSLDPEIIDTNRSAWIDEWTTIVLG